MSKRIRMSSQRKYIIVMDGSSIVLQHTMMYRFLQPYQRKLVVRYLSYITVVLNRWLRQDLVRKGLCSFVVYNFKAAVLPVLSLCSNESNKTDKRLENSDLDPDPEVNELASQ